MAKQLPPIPTFDPISTLQFGPGAAPAGSRLVTTSGDSIKVEDLAGYVTTNWVAYLQELVDNVSVSPERLALVELTGQNAAIASATIPISTVTTGYYRLTYYLRLTTAASTSSSITVSFGHTDSSASCTWSGTALTNNSITITGSQTALVRADASSALTYSVAYTSVGATAAVYKLSITAEGVSL